MVLPIELRRDGNSELLENLRFGSTDLSFGMLRNCTGLGHLFKDQLFYDLLVRNVVGEYLLPHLRTHIDMVDLFREKVRLSPYPTKWRHLIDLVGECALC